MNNIIKFPRKGLIVNHATGKVTADKNPYPAFTHQLFWATLLKFEESVKDLSKKVQERKGEKDGHSV